MSTTYSAIATPATRRASATSWSGTRCGGHLVEDAGDFERQRPVASELPRRTERHRRDPAGRTVTVAGAARASSALSWSACSIASRVGKWRYSVERPTLAAAASSAIVTCGSPISAPAAARIRWRLASASARVGPAASGGPESGLRRSLPLPHLYHLVRAVSQSLVRCPKTESVCVPNSSASRGSAARRRVSEGHVSHLVGTTAWVT